MIKSGYQWFVELGPSLVGRELVCVEKPGWLTKKLTVGEVYKVEDNKGLRVAGYLLSGFDLTKFTLKEKTVIDWTKPIVTDRGTEAHFIGFNKKGQAVTEIGLGEHIATVDAATGEGVYQTLLKVINELEPWEEAWNTLSKAEQANLYQYLFKKAFELGQQWTSKQKP